MNFSITEDIKSITELKQHATAVMRQVHETGRPVILTVNGKAEAVLVDAREYERMTQALDMMKALLVAEDDVKQERVREASSFFEEFRREKKI